jgi:hypothetical protein
MIWFAASIVSVIKYNNSEQLEYPVFEDVYLFSAENKNELDSKISERLSIINAAGECTYNGHAATQVCLGVRKIRSIYNEPPLDIDNAPPADGTELTHSFFLVNSIEDAQNMADGKRVKVTYVDDD